MVGTRREGKRAEDGTYLVQKEGDGYKHNGQKAQQAARSADADLVVHCRCEEGEFCKGKKGGVSNAFVGFGWLWNNSVGGRPMGRTSAKGTAHEIISGEHRGCVVGIRIAEVVEDGVEQQERADREPSGADDGHDPMDVGARRPAEPEQADGDAEAADKGGGEAEFGFELAVRVEVRFGVVV